MIILVGNCCSCLKKLQLFKKIKFSHNFLFNDQHQEDQRRICCPFTFSIDADDLLIVFSACPNLPLETFKISFSNVKIHALKLFLQKLQF